MNVNHPQKRVLLYYEDNYNLEPYRWSVYEPKGFMKALKFRYKIGDTLLKHLN